MRNLHNLLLLSAGSIILSGCSTLNDMRRIEPVKPWEKNILAKKEMQLGGEKVEAYFDSHIYFSKEASTGGGSVGGGGCGCN